MSFSTQLPGSLCLTKYDISETELPSAGGTIQKSCYSYVEKISGVSNPVSLQHDVIYANAFAAVLDRTDSCENETPLALGCVGHQPDKEFPLESKTPFPLPLIMYPTETNGSALCEMDMCAKPVLNWEEYMQDLKGSRRSVKALRIDKFSKGHTRSEGNAGEEAQERLNTISEEPLEDTTVAITESTTADVIEDASVPNDEDVPRSDTNHEAHCRADKLSIVSWRKLKNQPKLRIEGTWNHLYGGYNGACCFMKMTASKKLFLFSGKGSQLRAVKLSEAVPSSIFSLSVESIWEEDSTCSYFKNLRDNSSDPFDELIFQIVPNEKNQLLGVRRGRSIQIYNTDDDVPVLLETVPNVSYGTTHYHKSSFPQRKVFTLNPILRGFDFNPTNGPEIISIDENEVVRVCNVYDQSTSELFVLPNTRRCSNVPENYPDFKLNDASGVTFANHGQLFYAWGNSVVYLGDRRARKYSRTHIAPLFDLRNNVHSIALSSQNRFHESIIHLNEYLSCVRRSKKDPYYYVGSSSKIHLMDMRVPSHPVTVVSHGLQSPLTYMDTFSDEEEQFETIVAASQRSSETVCMISDMVHLECLQKPGCKGRSPLLYCYPRHLLNSTSYFDAVINEGYDFPHPSDCDEVKRHFYAWPTGVSVYPINPRGDAMLPGGMVVATSNNFGDLFWQEWGQKPLPSHRKTYLSDYKLKSYVKKWHEAMKRKSPRYSKRKSSKNPKQPTDCTILLEPLTKEIENLSRVRDSPFDCFRLHQIQNQTCMEAMLSMNGLCDRLSKYNGPQVKEMLDIWRENGSENPNPDGIEQVTIKTEPIDICIPLSPTGTIAIDLSDNEEEQLHTTERQKRSHIESTIRKTLNTHLEGESSQHIIQHSQDSAAGQWSQVYSDFFENTQSFNNPNDDIQELYSSQPSSARRSLKKAKRGKSIKPGFL